MNPELETAVEIASRLRDAVAAEVDAARAERTLLKGLDANGLFARAAERTAFLSDTARLERALASTLRDVAARLGLQEVTLDGLRARAGARGAALAEILSETRALSGALREIDRLNQELARRALVVVRGYVDALQPTPRAYDRYGGRSGAPALSLVSSKG